MKNKTSILGKDYKPSNQYFTKTLTRVKKEIFVPYQTNEPFVECIKKALFGGNITLDQNEIHESYDYWLHEKHIEEYAKRRRVTIDTYVLSSRNITGGRKVDLYKTYNPNERQIIALLQIVGSPKAWAWIIPNKRGHLPFISRKCCEICSIWMQSNKYRDHVKECMKCHCGRRHKQGDDHETTCKRPPFNLGAPSRKEKTDILISPRASKARKANFSSCHFADFEAFPEDGQYVIYAVANKSPHSLFFKAGKNCLSSFVLQLLNLRGTLWFFNGGRFDAYFLFVECVKSNITIVPKSLLKNGSTILSFSIKTDVGQLDVKDLYRFLPGSLSANCKAFDLDKELYKSDFDHSLIKNWDDVYKHMEKIEKYNKQDVIALEAVYTRFAETVFETHKIHVCKYSTASHMYLNAWLLTAEAQAISSKLIKTKREDEPIMRKFYRGGRIHIGQAEWKSKHLAAVAKEAKRGDINKIYWDLKEEQQKEFEVGITRGTCHAISRELYDTIDDYTVYLGVL
jgi:DNA polymerase type B, organellar and viral